MFRSMHTKKCHFGLSTSARKSGTFFIFASTIPSNKTIRLLISFCGFSCYAYVITLASVNVHSEPKKQIRISSRQNLSVSMATTYYTPLDFAYLANSKYTYHHTWMNFEPYTEIVTHYFCHFEMFAFGPQRHWWLNFFACQYFFLSI